VLGLALHLVGAPLLAATQSLDLRSPDGELVVELQLVDGVPTWQMDWLGEPLLDPGHLGFRPERGELGALETIGTVRSSVRESVPTAWGKCAEYADHYNGLRWELREVDGERRKLVVELRAYDAGVGLRYVLPHDGGWGKAVDLADDCTEFCFAGDYTGWSYAGEHDPLGPQPLSAFRSGQGRGARLPLTLRTPGGTHAAVLEAAVFDHAPFALVPSEAGPFAFRATFPASSLPSGAATSWRVVLVGREAGDLLVSPVTYCLNPPCALEDSSWIEPGLAMWDWRAWGATTDDGFTYGLDMPSWRRQVSFAAQHGIRYLVLDAGWYGLEFDEASDPRTCRDYLLVQPDPQHPQLVPQAPPEDWDDPIDVPELIRYGRERGVGIILYFNDIARRKFPFEETLALYERWGAAGIKYGFMAGGGQQKVLETREIIELCAQHRLLCDFHDGPVVPSGDRRTWPNCVAREFCHSQSDALRAFSPSGFCEQVFVNMLAGPLDMCNGLYTLEEVVAQRPKVFTEVPSTIVAETARVMITFSGLAILPDCPEAYEARADLFEFLSALPMTWAETRILQGAIGEFIVTARRHGSEWFVASATNEEARTLRIPLDFLGPGRPYSATLYEDAPDAHYLENREAYRVRRLEVTGEDTLDVTLAPGGGHCMRFSPR